MNKKMTNILYEHFYYLIKETKKPTYLDFYDLDDSDFTETKLCCYLEQTIRYGGKWFFVTTKKQYFGTEAGRDAAPKMLIKHLYQKPEPIGKEATK